MADEDVVDNFMSDDGDLLAPRRSGAPTVSRIAIIEELSSLTLAKPRPAKTVALSDPSKPAAIDIDSDKSITVDEVKQIVTKFLNQGQP